MNLITNNDKFLNIIFFYVIIIPFSLVLGDFTINLTIYSLSLLILLRSFLKNDWSYINFTLGKIFIFCWIYLIIISIFIHDINLKNITKSLVFGLNFIFALGLGYYLKELKLNKLKILSYIFLFIVIFIYIDMIYQFFNKDFKDIFGFKVNTIRSYEIFGKDVLLPIRLSGPFEGELVPGFYLSTIGFVSIFLFFYINNLIKNNKIFYTALFINFFFIIFSGERSSIIMSIITLSIFLVFYKNFKVSKILYIFLIITIIVFSVKINPATKERFDDFRVYTENENSLFKSFLKTDWGKHYKVSVMMINENKLFGTGIRSFRYECKKFLPSGCSTHPHHYVLEILVETGSIFLIFFLILNLNIIKMYFRDNIGHQVTSLGFLSIFLSFLFPVRPTGSIFSSWHGSFMWILLAFLLFSYKYKLKNNEK